MCKLSRSSFQLSGFVLLLLAVTALYSEGSEAQRAEGCLLETLSDPPSADVDLVVRTINTERGKPKYGARLARIVDKLHEEWDLTTGSLIGLQQVDTLRDCPLPPVPTDATSCFARLMADRYRVTTTTATGGTLGIVAVEPWTIVSHQYWPVGRDNIFHGHDPRYLLEVVARKGAATAGGPTLRFYVTHLSNGDQSSQRGEELDAIRDIVRTRAANDQTAPILVGDMNFSVAGDHAEPAHFNKLSTHFEQVNMMAGSTCHGDAYDQIWLGHKRGFPQATNGLLPLRHHWIDLASRDATIGIELSDHHMQGASLKVAPPNYSVTIKTGDVRRGGTDANVFVTLYGSRGHGREHLLDGPGDDFERASLADYELSVADIGTFERILVRHDNTHDNPGWSLSKVDVTSLSSNSRSSFVVNKWLQETTRLVEWVPSPPPSASGPREYSCNSNQKCCHPRPNGRCGECIPKNASCP